MIIVSKSWFDAFSALDVFGAVCVAVTMECIICVCADVQQYFGKKTQKTFRYNNNLQSSGGTTVSSLICIEELFWAKWKALWGIICVCNCPKQDICEILNMLSDQLWKESQIRQKKKKNLYSEAEIPWKEEMRICWRALRALY